MEVYIIVCIFFVTLLLYLLVWYQSTIIPVILDRGRRFLDMFKILRPAHFHAFYSQDHSRSIKTKLLKTCIHLLLPSTAEPGSWKCSKTSLELILLILLFPITKSCRALVWDLLAILPRDWSYTGRNMVLSPRVTEALLRLSRTVMHWLYLNSRTWWSSDVIAIAMLKWRRHIIISCHKKICKPFLQYKMRYLMGSKKNNPLFVWEWNRKNPPLVITVWHHSASLVMPNDDHRDGILDPTLTLMIDLIIVSSLATRVGCFASSVFLFSHVQNKPRVCSIGCPCSSWMLRLSILHSDYTVNKIIF